MKKKLTIIGLLGFTLLFGCTQTQNEAGANKESEFTAVSQEDFGGGIIIKFKHNDSGCYYIAKSDAFGGGGMTQMLNKDGLPICD